MNYDFSHLADDKTVLANPHKGWYYHYVDNGFQSAKYRDRLPEGNPFSDFPGMHHLYLRFDWVDVEKEEGKIDFSEIESMIARYRPYVLRFALRAECRRVIWPEKTGGQMVFFHLPRLFWITACAFFAKGSAAHNRRSAPRLLPRGCRTSRRV